MKKNRNVAIIGVGQTVHSSHREDVNQPEAASDRARVAEQVPNFPRAGVGREIEVLRRATEHEVADAAADEVREVPGPLEAVEDLERLPRDAAA